jgi:hypothetical protein
MKYEAEHCNAMGLCISALVKRQRSWERPFGLLAFQRINVCIKVLGRLVEYYERRAESD